MTTTTTLTPDAQYYSSGAWTTTGGTNLAVVTDANDGTYTRQTTYTVTSELYFSAANFTPTAGNYIARVRARLKVINTAASTFSFATFTVRGGSAYTSTLYAPPAVARAAATWVDGPWITLAPDFGVYPWTEYTVDNAGVYIRANSQPAVGDRPQIIEVELQVEENAYATLTTVLPSGTSVTDTSYPTVSWTFTDTEGDAQTKYRARIFARAVYEAAGFDSQTSATVYDSVLVTSSASSHIVTTPLPAGDYYAHVTVYQYIVNADTLVTWTGGASYFTMNVAGPPAPTVTATVDNTNQRVTITAQGFMNALTDNQASLTSTITGAWNAAGTNCTASRSTAAYDVSPASLLLTPTGSFGTVSTTSSALVSTVSASKSFTASAKVKAGTTARTCRVGIQFLTAALANTGSVTYGTGVVSNTSTWTNLKVVATSPADAAFAYLVVEAANTISGTDVHYFDTMALHPTNAGQTAVWSPGGGSSPTMTIWNSGYATDGQGLGYATVVNDGSQFVTWIDYTIPRGASRKWTVNQTVTLAAGTVSATTESSPVAIISDTTYWLKTKDGVVSIKPRIVGQQSTQREEQAGVFRPLDATKAVKVSGSLFGEDGSYNLLTLTTAEWSALEPVYRYQSPVCVQDPYGEQRWVAWTSRTDTVEGATSAPRHNVTLGYVEVEPPADS